MFRKSGSYNIPGKQADHAIIFFVEIEPAPVSKPASGPPRHWDRQVGTILTVMRS